MHRSLRTMTLNDELSRLLGAPYATREEWRNNSRKNEEMKPKQKQYPAVKVTGGRSKVWCCKEWYCIGTWNVRSMNQGKVEMIKQEMARVNVDILGISELKWTGIGAGIPQKKWSSHHGQQKSPNAVLGCNLKNGRMISVLFQGKPFNITVIQVYAPTSNTEEAEVERFYEDRQDLLELTPPKRCPFHYRGLEWKCRKVKKHLE